MRTTYHHGDLRNALLTTAVALIEEVGPERFTLREAARRVGVNHRAVYRHFADQRALFAAIAEEGYDTLWRELGAALDAAPPGAPGRLRALGAAYVTFAQREPALYQLMFGPRLNEDGAYPGLEAAVARCFDLVQDELRAGIAAGDLRDVPARDAALALWAQLHGLAALIRLRRIRVRPDAIAGYTGHLLELTLAGLIRG